MSLLRSTRPDHIRATGSPRALGRIVSLIAALSTMLVLTTAVAPAGAADSSCPSPGNACLWDAAGFGGYKRVLGAEWALTPYWIPLYTVKNSARSTFSNRAIWTMFYRDGVVVRWDCLGPWDYRLGDGTYRANYAWIGGPGSHC